MLNCRNREAGRRTNSSAWVAEVVGGVRSPCLAFDKQEEMYHFVVLADIRTVHDAVSQSLCLD